MDDAVKLEAAPVAWAEAIAKRCNATGAAIFVFDDEGGWGVALCGADDRRREEMTRWAEDVVLYAFPPELGE